MNPGHMKNANPSSTKIFSHNGINTTDHVMLSQPSSLMATKPARIIVKVKTVYAVMINITLPKLRPPYSGLRWRKMCMMIGHTIKDIKTGGHNRAQLTVNMLSNLSQAKTEKIRNPKFTNPQHTFIQSASFGCNFSI